MRIAGHTSAEALIGGKRVTMRVRVRVRRVLFVKHVEEAVGGRPVGLEQLDDERVLHGLRDGRLPPQVCATTSAGYTCEYRYTRIIYSIEYRGSSWPSRALS